MIVSFDYSDTKNDCILSNDYSDTMILSHVYSETLNLFRII